MITARVTILVGHWGNHESQYYTMTKSIRTHGLLSIINIEKQLALYLNINHNDGDGDVDDDDDYEDDSNDDDSD